MKHFLLFAISLVAISCAESQTTEPTPTIPAVDTVRYGSVHLETGIPKDKDSTDDYLILRPQYVMSYNAARGGPNWVSWNLNSGWYGDVARYSGNFITDTSLPATMYRVKHSDYTNGGYDRGHMVRSEERTVTVEDNKSTFLCTNLLPQLHNLNAGPWLDLEYYCEDLCKKSNKELYIMAGGAGYSGRTLLDAGKVAIPDSTWKIVVVMERGQKLVNISTATEIIAVMMPNDESVTLTQKFTMYKTTIRNIEARTGYDFLRAVPKAVQDVIEGK